MSGSINLGGNLLPRMNAWQKNFDVGLNMYCNTVAKNPLEEDAKNNAPWTDRTGQARQRLTAYVTKIQPGVYEITLAHGVSYGIWLELAHEKRFATIMPTINKDQKEIMNGLKILMGEQ